MINFSFLHHFGFGFGFGFGLGFDPGFDHLIVDYTWLGQSSWQHF
jgi:hypothetical protein